MPQVGYSHRSLALGRRGMVAAAHPYAALAGLDVLKAGGTAAAAHGFPTTSFVSQVIREYASVTPDAEWHRVFTPGGRGPEHGGLLVQADLARTLTEIAAHGPDTFYRGRVAEAIARRLEGEGFLTAQDLAKHSGEWGEPISAMYRGVRIYETPPPTQGLATLLGLNMLEGFDLKD